MPLYEYECTTCQHRFEVIQKFSDPAIEICPACGGAVHKLPSSPAIQFKGSGWYITDYARAGKKEDAGKPASGDVASSGPAAGGGEATGGSKAEGKSESKAESKPDSKPDSKSAAGSKSTPPSA